MQHNRSIVLEVACFTPQSALTAANAGAGRVELCSGYSEGGLSPSAASVMMVRDSLTIPLHVMVRPRIGDFIYTSFEKEVIGRDIAYCKDAGADGVVMGALLPSGQIDKDFTRSMVEKAYPMTVTFHRAFDLSPDLHQSLETLIECGVSRILTSGGKPTVRESVTTIASLVKRASGKLIILPGGGIRHDNALDIIKKTGAREIHISGKRLVTGNMQINPSVSLSTHGEVSDTSWYETDHDQVRNIVMQIGQKG